jgi:Ca2+-dependent lipid-binding protein
MTDHKKTQRVSLTLYASKLKNVAGAFKGTSDPYAVVTLLPNTPNEKPTLLGKTEVIKNSLSPHWTKTFELEYELGQLTRFNVGVYDEIRKAKHNKPMGSAVFEVGEILGARGNLKAKKMRNGGTLFCTISTAAPQSLGQLNLGLRAIGLKNVDGLFSKSDPFVEISAKTNTPGGLTWQPVYRSKPVMNDLNPVWNPISLDLNQLCPHDDNTDEDPLERRILI